MLKHIHIPQSRRSLSSEDGSHKSGLSSGASSGSESRCSSALSSVGEAQTGIIKVFCSVLRPDVEYKTLKISTDTRTKEVVHMLLRKCKMRNRDPNLYYISMEISMLSQSVEPMRSVLILDDNARPLELKICQPSGYSVIFCLRCKKGGLVKIHDSCLNPASQYKSLLVSQRTTVEEVIQLLLNCHGSPEFPRNFALVMVFKDKSARDFDHEFPSRLAQSNEYEYRLSPQDIPLLAREHWSDENSCSFHLRRQSDSSSPLAIFKSTLPFVTEQSYQDSLPWSSRAESPLFLGNEGIRQVPELHGAATPADNAQSHYVNYFYI